MPPDYDADPNAEEGTGKEGAPAGAKKSSEDDDRIPKSQFLAALDSANRKFEALQADFTAFKAAASKPQETKPPTEVELEALVEAGTITRAQANAELKRQTVAEATKAAMEVARSVTAGTSTAGRIEADLAEYKKLVGEAWVPGSEQRTKVEAAYRRLVARGLPDGVSTELTALENVFGDIDALRESKKARSGPSEHHSETGGGKPNGGGGGGKDDAPKGLDARTKAHYERAISRGIYKDWSAVKAELADYEKRQKRA